MNSSTCYLNTDLDLTAKLNPSALIQALEAGGMLALNVSQADNGIWLATLETVQQYPEPESNIAAILVVIEQLSSAERQLWQDLKTREFNIGYTCENLAWGFSQALSSSTLQRVANVNGALRITLYPTPLIGATNTQ